MSQSALQIAVRPLRQYADLQGRSTRTEILYFWVLLMAISAPLIFVLPGPGPLWATLAINVATVVPTLAVMTRRLHDVGWSGWWLAPAIPLVLFNAWRMINMLQNPFGPYVEVPVALIIPTGIYGLGISLLLVWDDEEGANRFGPNPRAWG